MSDTFEVIQEEKSKYHQNLMQKWAKYTRFTKLGPKSDTFFRYFLSCYGQGPERVKK